MSKYYFTQETEDAIIEYNNTSDPSIKSRIYEEKINYPFFKLTQNIIHTFKFYYTEVENLEDLQHEIIIFLLGKIHLYNHADSIQKRIKKILEKEFNIPYEYDFVSYVNNAPKVTKIQIQDFILFLENNIYLPDECLIKLRTLVPPKAYSYFGTIVKRWLILYNDANYKNLKETTSVSTLDEDICYSYTLEENQSMVNVLPHNDKISLFMDLYIEYCTNNIYTLFPKEIDAKIADAILELFRKREFLDLSNINKKAMYIYIKEMVDCKTPKITKISIILNNIFEKGYIFYLEHGYIKF
jgi:hypothetical protein